ncbi:WXG100 family type VII secretion target [Candidatus Viridilinea mediisalina]|uniref:ESAT-6-like protein n=1 Tax=Candidatus Viridilinea mediisalina TaxID=2024553 RepID=A0A2A6RG10_9CHLR|nr:WXG100 family type VII secretion target [Candidatus Viridilinea mediisalina]PDW01818.1 hypothetical protein CJ255_17175 [Candidatus Viridilinea mediisalina]
MSVYDSMISLDVELAEATIQTLNRCRDSIEQELNAMLNSSNSVVATWEGNSRVQFEAQWQEAQDRLRQIIDQITLLSQGLERTKERFREAAASFG